jgi:tetratricopeptide (TPR) repeat protein
VAVAVLVLHAAGTHARNRVWRDDLSLWEDVARKSPDNGRGLMNHGVALMSRGLTRQALREFERAAELVPQYEVLQINLAIAKDDLGLPGAEGHFRRALEIAPRYARGRYFYAVWLVDEARAPEAVTQLERALEASGGDLDARTLLARLLAARGDDAALAAVVAGTLAIAPDEPVALAYRRGGDPVTAAAETWEAYAAVTRRRAAAGEWLEAAGAARRGVALAPGSAAAWNDLGWVRLSLGFVAEAIPCLERSVALEPSARAQANLALARRRLAGGAGTSAVSAQEPVRPSDAP